MRAQRLFKQEGEKSQHLCEKNLCPSQVRQKSRRLDKKRKGGRGIALWWSWQTGASSLCVCACCACKCATADNSGSEHSLSKDNLPVWLGKEWIQTGIVPALKNVQILPLSCPKCTSGHIQIDFEPQSNRDKSFFGVLVTIRIFGRVTNRFRGLAVFLNQKTKLSRKMCVCAFEEQSIFLKADRIGWHRTRLKMSPSNRHTLDRQLNWIYPNATKWNLIPTHTNLIGKN